MKENFIQTVVATMQRNLNCCQMAKLKAVLIKELQDVEIIESKKKQHKEENKDLLEAFLSAKKIEGCSDKSLSYYKKTIERFLKVVDLAICHISTTDRRQYLSHYQEKRKSSKVTIVNVTNSKFFWKSACYL